MNNNEAWLQIIEWQFQAREVVQVWPNKMLPFAAMRRIDQIVETGPLAYRGSEMESPFCEVCELRDRIVSQFVAWAKQMQHGAHNRHPWYGPCDSFGDGGECSECRHIDLGCWDEGWFNEDAIPETIEGAPCPCGSTACHACPHTE
jgi:hypothetical protein